MIAFTSDQQTAMLEWLESLKDAGLTLDDVIEGLINGTLTATISDEASSLTV